MPSLLPSRRSRSLFALPLVLAIGTLARTASATVVALSTAELTEASSLVIVGRVARTQAQWTPDHQRIVTLAAVLVDDVVKGQWGRRRVIVEREGGEVGDMGLLVTDTPSFAKGERVVLFLTPAREERGQTIHHVVGEIQGKYQVDERDVAKKKDIDAVGDVGQIDFELPFDELIAKIRRAVK
ncbi:MAG: hypothetical protein HYR85_21180 [Planctomycetes bacterium]|nr:hypothetical protein [Planctomycetota bacterium]